MNQRPSVKNVILSITYPEGQKETTVVSGDKVEGLFFNHRAVNKILAPFYNTYKSTYTREKLIDACGAHALPLMGKTESLRITPRVVEELWNLKDQNGMLPPYMEKTLECGIIPGMNFSGYQAGRPEVTGITVELRHPDGRETSTVLDPAKTEALVWSDRAALEILAPFYDTYESIYTRETLTASCGIDALPLMGGKQHLRVTPQLVENLWNLKDQNDMLPPYMEKSIFCTPHFSEMKSIVVHKAA